MKQARKARQARKAPRRSATRLLAKRETSGLASQPSRDVATIGDAPASSFGPDAPEETTPEGGRHSLSPWALDVVPNALLRVGRVFFNGERKREEAPQLVGRENWRKITSRMHARHMLNHVLLYLAGDRSEDHLEHAVARGLFAIECDLEKSTGDGLAEIISRAFSQAFDRMVA